MRANIGSAPDAVNRKNKRTARQLNRLPLQPRGIYQRALRHNLPVDTISRQVIGKALQLLPAQCRAGRALIEWTIDDLARASAVPAAVIADFETGRTPVEPESIDAIAAALEHGGVRFIPEGGGGAGVRLKFTRSEVARIATLENEGGIVAEDDV